MPDPDPAIAARRRSFRELHASGCFVIPNPWDIGSARFLHSLGFKALASSSAGFAWSRGRADGTVTLDEVLAHLRELVCATELPVNADFENGYADDAEGVHASVRRAVATGVAGLSIEDATGDASDPIYDHAIAVARLRAARVAIDEAGGDTVLVGRAENFIRGRPYLDDTIARLQAYAAAGADCLYAPGVRKREDIAAVVAAVAPKPLNVLAGGGGGLSVAQLAALGVRRISVGSALARSAWAGFQRAARAIALDGQFDAFADSPTVPELDALFVAKVPGT